MFSFDQDLNPYTHMSYLPITKRIVAPTKRMTVCIVSVQITAVRPPGV